MFKEGVPDDTFLCVAGMNLLFFYKCMSWQLFDLGKGTGWRLLESSWHELGFFSDSCRQPAAIKLSDKCYLPGQIFELRTNTG